MTPIWLRTAVDNFWSAAGEIEPFPRRLESAISWGLPLAILKIPRLCVTDVKSRLISLGIEFKVSASDRDLHGCLVAFGGRGLVMLDGSDPGDELRFSLAHEVGHFLIDYQQPRNRALRRLGPDILDVLDGLRRPTKDERIDAVLSDVSIGVHVHLMDRSASGSIGCGRIAGSEFHADRLALELLAPEDEVWRAAQVPANLSREEMITTTARTLRDIFGLPGAVAADYARFLAAIHSREPSVRAWLGMG